MRLALKEARRKRGWSQAELGRRSGLPQMHISGIETGKIVPRFDTLLDLVRVLGHDLLMMPRALVPVVQALVRDQGSPERHGADDDRPLYAAEDEEAEEQAEGDGRRRDEA
ncbi:MAG: helix-turn-helix transcriptional regulator [Alphaproteobacteria bacterium]